jgi:hypothetical protein
VWRAEFLMTAYCWKDNYNLLKHALYIDLGGIGFEEKEASTSES